MQRCTDLDGLWAAICANGVDLRKLLLDLAQVLLHQPLDRVACETEPDGPA